MFKAFKIVFLALIFVTLGYTYNTFATEEITNYNDLIENGKSLDGKKVKIKGEAIGEPMNRGEYTWVNISDGSTAIGIWMKSSDAQKINFYGNHRTKGDIVKISGEFHRACAEHGGDMDIHSESIEIYEEGYSLNETINKRKGKSALILSLITSLLSIIFIKSRKKYLL